MQKDILYSCASIIYAPILILYGLSGCDEPKINSYSQQHPSFCGTFYLEEAICLRPWLPNLDQIPLDTIWPLTHPHEASIQTSVSYDIDVEEPTEWSDQTQLKFDRLGPVKVFVKVDSFENSDRELCVSQSFSHTYEVVDAYDAEAEQPESEAIHMDDPRFIQWGEVISEVNFGSDVGPGFRMLDNALGKASGGAFNVVSLGRGGELTYFFEDGIANGPDTDFAIFENSFSDYFLELGKVEVSSDGIHYVTIPHAYLGQEAIDAFGEHEPSLIDGLVGKYKAGYGTPFDLSTLAWSIEAQSGLIDLHAVRYVRIIDIIGDGSMNDTFQNPIYDPYPTQETAGLDLDAIGIVYSSTTTPCPLQ